MSVLSGNTYFFPWEVNLIEWLQTHIGGAGISLISHLSIFGEEMLMILIVGFVYWSYDKKLGRTIGLTAIMGLAWSTMIKNIALRRDRISTMRALRLCALWMRRRTSTTSQHRVILSQVFIPPMRQPCSAHWQLTFASGG